MLKKYQRYLFGEYAKYCAVGILSIVGLFVVVEGVYVVSGLGEEQIEALGSGDLFFILADIASRIFGLTAPIICLFAAIALLTVMGSANELTALNNFKRSFLQIIGPLLWGGAGMMIIFYLNQTYLHDLIRENMGLIPNSRGNSKTSQWVAEGSGLVRYTYENSKPERPSKAYFYGMDENRRLEKILSAENDGGDGGYFELNLNAEGRVAPAWREGQPPFRKIPEGAGRGVDLMHAGAGKLYDLHRDPRTPETLKEEIEVAVLNRLATLVSIPILIFLAAPLTLGGPRASNMNRGLIAGISVCYSYFILNEILGVLVKERAVNVFAGSFAVNFLFLALGVLLFLRAK